MLTQGLLAYYFFHINEPNFGAVMLALLVMNCLSFSIKMLWGVVTK